MALESQYRRRIVDDELDELVSDLPALALVGPKGVGKTATAGRRAKTIHALDETTAPIHYEGDTKSV